MARRYDQPCPIATALDVVGDRWTLLVVRDLLYGPKRFQAIQESLSGIAANMLSGRLKHLEQVGIVGRRFYSDHPPRAEYLLTAKGQELETVIGALATWGSEHAFQGARFVHESCGHALEVRFHCNHCGKRVERGETAMRKIRGRRGSRAPA